MAAAAPPDSTLLSLSEDLLLAVLQHVHNNNKPALLRTCKTLRQAVLLQAPRLTLNVNCLGSDFRYSEARAVVRRGRRMEVLTLNIVCGQMPWPQNFRYVKANAQRLVAALAAPPAEGEHPCAVSTLAVQGDVSSCPGLVGAFPSITALEVNVSYIDTDTLQVLAQCTRLAKLSIRWCSCEEDVVPQIVSSCLPAVRDLTLALDTHLWLPALAPHLTRLRCEVDGLEPPAISALAQCTQLVEVYLTGVDQATLEVLLGLPSLTKVAFRYWTAQAGGRHCTWAQLMCEDVSHADMIDLLPRGVHTLALTDLYLHTAATPAASLAATQALTGALLRACHSLRFGRAEGVSIEVKTHQSPINLTAACVEATLQGLASLHPMPHNVKLKLYKVSEVSEALVRALSAASNCTTQLSVVCEAVAPGAWAALPATLPAMHECSFIARTLSEDSMAALGALCRNPGVAGGSTALRRITIWLLRCGGGWASLELLQAELAASGAPVKLRVGDRP